MHAELEQEGRSVCTQISALGMHFCLPLLCSHGGGGVALPLGAHLVHNWLNCRCSELVLPNIHAPKQWTTLVFKAKPSVFLPSCQKHNIRDKCKNKGGEVLM